MYLDQIASTPTDAVLIARDSVAAVQWEVHLLERDLLGGARAGRAVTSWSGWLAASWDALRPPGPGDSERSLLSGDQTGRLWQRVIAESDEGEALLGLSGLAAAARAARASLFALGVQPGRAETADWRGDSGAFLRWNGRFERELGANGWIDPDSLLFELNRSAAFPPSRETQVLLDPVAPTPEVAAMLARSAAVGREIPLLRPDLPQAEPQARLASDPGDEIEQAAAFAAERLSAAPDARIAVVVPDLESRREELIRRFRAALGAGVPLSPESGPRIATTGIVGAALSAIELLSGPAGFDSLSRLLRSPFFSFEGEAAPDRTALLEFSLRTDSRAEESFVASYRHYGLRALLAESLPELVTRLDHVLARMPTRATPTAWAQFWQASLRTLGWEGFSSDLPEQLHAAWERVWSVFAGLTPIVGRLSAAEARDELARVAHGQRIYAPPAMTGVHLLRSPEQVGPGYTGVWVTGFTDQAWPPAAEHNPLLPWTFRAERGLPGADPGRDLALAAEAMAGLLARVPEAVFSCPARVLDQPQVPNPHFRDWRDSRRHAARATTAAAVVHAAPALEQVQDPAPPLAGHRIPGGPRTLDLQAHCPVLAFCVSRLRAEPLPAVSRGLDSRLRGILMHRALELLLAGEVPGEEPVERAVEAAAGELLLPGGAAWQRQIRAEKARMQRILAAFVDAEAGREEFATIAVEQRIEIRLAEHALRCRIDRIDRLADGGLVIIDYKTGRRMPTGWLTEPLSDTQLPLYAQQFAAEVAGILAIRLGEDAIEYRGVGRIEAAIPGRPTVLDAEAWRKRLKDWRSALEALIEAFADGDVRVSSADMSAAAGPYAAVTRVLETVA